MDTESGLTVDTPSVETGTVPGPDMVGDMSSPARTATTEPLEPTDRKDGRDSKGQFVKGNWGNRGGTSKPDKQGSLSKALDGIVDRSELAKVLWNLSLGKDRYGRTYKRPNLSVQLAAVQYVYDRLEGKPLLQLRHESDDLPTFIIMHGRDAGAIIEGEARELPEGETAPDDLDVKRAPIE